jgi:uncharacterized protein (TIGR02231 family)
MAKTFGSGVWLATLALLASAALAQQESRIERVTVYPGLAAVERTARVSAGARELVLNCLSASFDLASLRLSADAGIRLGAVSAVSRPRAEVPECSRSELDGRIRALQQRQQALDAEALGHELALGYLRGLAPPADAAAPRPPAAPGRGQPMPPVAELPAALAAIQRAGQATATEQNRIAEQRAAIERELRPLLAERDRLGRQEGEVRQLRIALDAGRDGSVRLHYQVAGPTWAPAYRATLDVDAGQLEIDRLAQVSQRSGEDWSGVNLRLSTGSPRGSASGPQPRRWTVVPQPPVAAAPAAAAAPSLLRSFSPPATDAAAQRRAGAEAPMEFAVQVSQGEFATEFEVPGTVDVGSGAQRVNFALDRLRVPAAAKVQTTPQADASAWLVAEFARPAGVWPDGPLQLLRGAQVVGQGVWSLGTRERITLSFGRDEQVRVQVVPSQATRASAGFIGSRSERRIGHAYVVENRRRSAIQLEVLEASPVSVDEQIQVTTQFEPEVLPGFWQDQPGIVVWARTLAPGESARFSASYVISHPKELPVSDRR